MKILLLAIVFFTFLGCSREMGCTDPTAINFNSAAEEDNGTCEYPPELECLEESENRPQFPLEQPDMTSQEIYDIYSLVINDKYSSNKIVVKQTTMIQWGLNCDNYPNFCDSLINNHLDFDTNLVKIYKDINEVSINFGEQFYSETNDIILISGDELSYVFEGEDLICNWNRFYNYYETKEIIGLSRIAFNKRKTQAVFEMSRSCGALCGNGSIIFLKKIEGVWTVADIILTWIS